MKARKKSQTPSPRKTRRSGPPRKSAPLPPEGRKLVAGMVKAAHAGGAILRMYYERMNSRGLKISEKKNAGLVTNADLESERAVVAHLRKLRPDFGFLTEEATITTLKPTRGRFIIDPLDGTTNFVHGFPMFCVSLAAEWDGKMVAAVIFHPILRETYTAWTGGGSFLNGKRMRVSDTTELKDSLLTTGFATYRRNPILQESEMQVFEEVSGIARAVRRPGSAALDLAYTARGVFDGYWERNLSPWDTAAGFLLVEEAGGRVTDLGGHAYQVDAPGILASNGRLHERLVDLNAVDLLKD